MTCRNCGAFETSFGDNIVRQSEGWCRVRSAVIDGDGPICDEAIPIAVFKGLAEGQGVMASSWYEIDARRVTSMESAMDVGPEGNIPTVFWVIDASAYDAEVARIKAAKEEALATYRVTRMETIDVIVEGVQIQLHDQGYGNMVARGPEVNWTDYTVREVRA